MSGSKLNRRNFFRLGTRSAVGAALAMQTACLKSPEAEKAFDRELKPHIEAETNGVNGIVKKIESCSTELRRQEAARIFS